MERKELKPRLLKSKFEMALTSHVANGLVFNVNLRELHSKLKNGKQFVDWIKDRVEKYDFLENKDYVLISLRNEIKKSGRGGDRCSLEYIGTLLH